MANPDQLTLDVEGIILPFDVFASESSYDVLCPICGKAIEYGYRMLQFHEHTLALLPRGQSALDHKVTSRPIHTRCARRHPAIYRHTWRD